MVNYGTDIPNLIGDHKRYMYGPGMVIDVPNNERFSLTNSTGSILVAHSDHEHISVGDLEAAVKGYKLLIEHSLK